MAEVYEGVKFTAEKVEGDIDEVQKVKEIVTWCKELVKLNIAPSYGEGTSGNLSIRTTDGFLITPTAVFFEKLKEDEVVEVVAVDFEKKLVRYKGNKTPSSEVLMHQVLYQGLKEVRAIFHIHDEKVMAKYKELSLPITAKEVPYGTEEAGELVLQVASQGRYIIINGHGNIALGKDAAETGKLVVGMHEKACNLQDL